MAKRKSIADMFISDEKSESQNQVELIQVENVEKAKEEPIQIKEVKPKQVKKQEIKTEVIEKEISKTEEIPTMQADEVSSKTVTIIENQQPQNQQLQTVEKVEEIILSDREQHYLEITKEIRNKIDNPTPKSRLDKRRKYSDDERRNVTINIRKDLSMAVDDLVDDAKIFKGLFHDELIVLGIEAYIKKYRLK